MSMLRKLIVTAVFVLAATPALAAGARDKLVVSPAWLAQHLNDKDLVVLQVGDKASYDAGHIPGARLVNLPDLAAPPAGPDALTLEMPDAASLHDKLQALGISDNSKVVVYYGKDMIQSATRVVFTLDYAGLGDRTVLLDGGINAWAKAGQATSTDVPVAKVGNLAALKIKPIIVDADFVKSHIGAKGYSIVDARAPEFYSGARAGGSAAKPQKAGHIASAKSIPFSSVTTGSELQLAPEADLEAKFAAAGIKPGDTVIAYCHVGQQATAAIFAARQLGYDVRLYDGSFEDWFRKDGPVETAPAK